MSKLRFGIHPLYLVIGLYYVICGKVWIFVSFLAAVTLHEYAHKTIARSCGYAKGRIVLMPYGAVLVDTDIMSKRADILVSSAGAAANAAVMLILLGTWWAVPDLYVITYDFYTANAVIALINLIPAYPLDGARLVLAVLGHGKKTVLVLKIFGCAIGIIMVVLGIISTGYVFNPSMIVMGLFLMLGGFVGGGKDKYYRIASMIPFMKNHNEPIINKSFVIDGEITLKRLLRYIRRDSYAEFIIYCDGEKIVIDENLLGELTGIFNLNTKTEEIAKYLIKVK